MLLVGKIAAWLSLGCYALVLIYTVPRLVRVLRGVLHGDLFWPGPPAMDMSAKEFMVMGRIGIQPKPLFPTLIRSTLGILASLALMVFLLLVFYGVVKGAEIAKPTFLYVIFFIMFFVTIISGFMWCGKAIRNVAQVDHLLSQADEDEDYDP